MLTVTGGPAEFEPELICTPHGRHEPELLIDDPHPRSRSTRPPAAIVVSREKTSCCWSENFTKSIAFQQTDYSEVKER